MNDSDTVVTCSNCGGFIGKVITRNSREMLLLHLFDPDTDERVVAMAVYRFHGFCFKCEHQVHWDSGEIKLRRLIRHAKENLEELHEDH